MAKQEKVEKTKVVPDGCTCETMNSYEAWLAAQRDCGLQVIGRESGKNSILQTLLGTMQYITDLVSAKHKARIVFDYDPDALNWVITIFTDKDAPIPEDIR